MGLRTRLYAVSAAVFNRFNEADQLDDLLGIVTGQSDDGVRLLEETGMQSLDLDQFWPDFGAVLELLDERYAYLTDAQSLECEREPGDSAEGDFAFWTPEGVSLTLHEFALMFFEVVAAQYDPAPDSRPETIAAFLKEHYAVMLQGDLDFGL